MSDVASHEPDDLRVRRTHKLLWEALVMLMGEQAFEEISVKDICDRAMVHRTTFYRHYADKYDLLARGVQQTHATMLAELELTPNDTAAYAQFFAHVAEHQRFYRIALDPTNGASSQARLQRYFADTITAELQRQAQSRQPPDIPRSLIGEWYAGAVMGALAWWFAHDLATPPERMGAYLQELLGASVADHAR